MVATASVPSCGNLLDDAIAGHGSLVLISGEAGIGKTTLVRSVAQEATENGWIVIRGGCYDLTTTPPYGPWIEAFFRSYQPTSELPFLSERIRDEQGIQQLGSRGALFLEIDRLIAEIAEHTPLLIVLEDLHWTDEASADLLRFLARQLPDQRILIVATYRDDEIDRGHPLYGQLPAILREAPVERILLRRLQREEAGQAREYALPIGDIRSESARWISSQAERWESFLRW